MSWNTVMIPKRQKFPRLVDDLPVLAPGNLIREELAARGWTQRDLAMVLGRPLQAINQIVNGRKRLTPETAMELGLAFGTSPELWLNLEVRHQLSRARRPRRGIARRAERLMAKAG